MISKRRQCVTTSYHFMSSSITGNNIVIVVSGGRFVGIVFGYVGIGSVVAGTPIRRKSHEITWNEVVVASAPPSGQGRIPIFNQDQCLTEIVHDRDKQKQHQSEPDLHFRLDAFLEDDDRGVGFILRHVSLKSTVGKGNQEQGDHGDDQSEHKRDGHGSSDHFRLRDALER